jgi:hypothetical protein
MAPAYANHSQSYWGWMAYPTASNAPRLPFASTCPQSRWLPFEYFSASPTLRLLKARESALEEIKNVSNKIAHGSPPIPKIKPPVITAAQAPLRESEPAFHASPAMMSANHVELSRLKDKVHRAKE